MIDRQAALFDKARRALDTARLNLDHGDTEAAINRAYYSAYYTALAALLTHGETPKTHSGTHDRFYLHFVHSGHLPVSVGKTLKFAFNLRQRADYETFAVFDEAAAADLITDVEAFVQAVEEMLGP